MEIKKLTKQEKDEGLTVELVNSIDLKKKASPVMFLKGDEPVKLVKCSTGYWVMYHDGKYLKDKDNKLMVFEERECQIARARYLFYYLDREKQEEVDLLLQSRKRKVDEKIKIIEHNLQSMKDRIEGKGWHHGLIESLMDSEQLSEQLAEYNAKTKELKENLPEYERIYNYIMELYKKGEIITLLNMFDIEKMPNPVFTASFDNENDMRILKNSFEKKSLDSSNGDMNVLLARLTVEKNYTL
jgi:hypothetical protein